MSFTVRRVPPPPPRTAAAVLSVGLPASLDGARQEHADARWTGWLSRQDRDDATRRLRFRFIAGLMAIGVVAWLWWVS